MHELILNFFNLAIYKSVTPILLQGLAMTVLLSVLIIPLGLFFGLVLSIVYLHVTNRIVKALLILYIDVFRAIPPLVLLILVYFGLPFLNIEITNLTAVILCFVLNNSCYYGEVFRSGLISVPKGQAEAARSTGLSFLQSLLYVQIPQATRNVMPDLISNSLEIVKLTTIASAVALPEVLHMAQNAQSLLYNPSPIVLAGIFFLILLVPVVRLISHMERRRLAGHRSSSRLI
ncbi:amino acid ABC transporter permease [Castellaniella sp.]|uniref:amino acid ABC transporter permease n=1 Tax=Castellaniella sp. TaxID=1955812 RepID=UPI002AFE3F5D|nr:amino acid ABC transporter permease [Castellaniella sp.]